MYHDLIRQRITELRLMRNLSEYKLSMDLGHSKGYIQSITSGHSLPSLESFLEICEYFNITPSDFFLDIPSLLHPNTQQILIQLQQLSDSELILIQSHINNYLEERKARNIKPL